VSLFRAPLTPRAFGPLHPSLSDATSTDSAACGGYDQRAVTVDCHASVLRSLNAAALQCAALRYTALRRAAVRCAAAAAVRNHGVNRP